MNSLFSFVLAALFVAPTLRAQDSSPVETTFKVFGNCGMCKKRIEKAVAIDEVTSATWKKTSKLLTVVYRPEKVSADSLQKRVAAAGHDTERFKAPDSVYAALPACCLYRGGGNTH